MPDTDYKHPKCYANLHGGCSTKISGEHYISHSLIKLYTFDDPTVRILHDNGFGIPHPVPPNNFVANVLCSAHNTLLSPADDAALEFASFLRRVALTWLNGAGAWEEEESIEVSGDDFQRWILKLLVTHAVAGAFASNGERVISPIPDDAIHLLLDLAAWPRTWGLCVAAEPGNEYLRHDPFSDVETVLSKWWWADPMFTHGDNSLCGGFVQLAGVGFGLSLFNQGRGLPEFEDPENPLRGSIQRPAYMAWELQGVQKRVNFSWSDDWQRRGVTYRMVR
ncbi:hypothetical protein AB0F65_07225 [Nocardia rhamnosiphila]|uniref:hypothetical protein n=1 Tax=Nocardia rhamnosiphila TaxID=426716 RepID=UPI0033CD4EAA